MNLGNFAAYGGGAVLAEGFAELGEGTFEPERALIYKNGAGFLGEFGESGLPPLFEWEKTFEAESVARETGGNECGDERRGAGEAADFYVGFTASSGEHEAGVGDAGCTGV